jgi:hypothetical protein
MIVKPLSLPVLSLALAAMGCIPAPPQTTVEPRTGHVQVWRLAACKSGVPCAESRIGPVYEGPVVRLDSAGLEVFDLSSQTRIAVLADQPAAVAVYRGQRHGADLVAKGAGRGALFGAASGLFAALVLKVAYGAEVDLGETSRGGVTAGVIAGGINGAAQAAGQGGPAWERLSIRQLYEERMAAPAKTP